MAKGSINLLPPFKIVRFYYNQSNAGTTTKNNSGKGITKEEIGYYVPEGYVPFSVVDYHTTKPSYVCTGINPFADSSATDAMQYFALIRNASGAAAAVALYARIAFIRKDLQTLIFRKRIALYTQNSESVVISDSVKGSSQTSGSTSYYWVIPGTQTSLSITNPVEGYLYHIMLSNIDSNDIIIDGTSYSFTMPDNNIDVSITRTGSTVSRSIYSNADGGTFELYNKTNNVYQVGDTVQLLITINDGYYIHRLEVSYYETSGTTTNQIIVPISSDSSVPVQANQHAFKFIMPNASTVHAVLYFGKS